MVRSTLLPGWVGVALQGDWEGHRDCCRKVSVCRLSDVPGIVTEKAKAVSNVLKVTDSISALVSFLIRRFVSLPPFDAFFVTMSEYGAKHSPPGGKFQKSGGSSSKWGRPLSPSFIWSNCMQMTNSRHSSE